MGDISTTTFVNLTGAVANAAGVEGTDTRVDVVTDAVFIFICSARSTAFVEGVELVSVTVAVFLWNVCTTAFIDFTGAVTNAASVEGADTRVDIVTDSVFIGVRRARSTALLEGVELVTVAVAVTLWDIRATAFVDVAGTVADSTGI